MSSARWYDMHTFTPGEVYQAKWFEWMRRNLEYLRRPAFAVSWWKTPYLSGYASSTTNWAAVNPSWLDPVVIQTTGRDVLVAANPQGQTDATDTFGCFGMRWDGNFIESSTDGSVIFPIRSDYNTWPIMHIIRDVPAGEHTLELMFKRYAGTSLARIAGTSKTFLLAMEI